MNPSRRRFLVSTATAAACIPWVGCHSPSAARHALPVLDTHTHFYDPSRPEGVPWPGKNDTELYRPVLPAEFIELTRPFGVEGTVVVEASPRESDNEWVLQLATQYPVLLGLVGHLKPGTPDFQTRLQTLTRNPRFRGIRTGGWNLPLEPNKDPFIRDIAKLADRGLTLDVNVGTDQLPAVASIAATLPHLSIVINHVGNVRIDGKSPPSDWLKNMESCAAHPRIFCKVSGLVEGTGRRDQKAPSDTAYYQHILETVWNLFGEHRVIFGSNWPVSSLFAPYATVFKIAKEFAESRGAGAMERFFHQNARGLYLASAVRKAP